MNTFIDLNGLSLTEASFRSFFQKLGRVLRVYPGKDNVTVASFLSVDDPDFLEWFEFIDELKQESFGIKSYDSTEESKEKKEGEARKNKFEKELNVAQGILLEKKSFFQQFDKEILSTFSKLLTDHQQSFTDFMTIKGLDRDDSLSITKYAQKFFIVYFSNKFNIKSEDVAFKKLFESLKSLKQNDFDNQQQGGPVTVRFFSVFLEMCKIKEDEEINCNTSAGMETFFKKYIKIDTSSLDTYVAFIQDYRESMDNFMVSKGSNETTSKDTKTFLKAYFQYKWDIESIENKDKYTELRDAIRVLSQGDFNRINNIKTSQIRLYNVFLQACKVAQNSKGEKYNCNEQNSNKNNSIQQFFKDHIEFDTSSLGNYVALIQNSREGIDNFMVSKGSKETTNKNTQTLLEAYFQYKWDIQDDKYTELRDAIRVLSQIDLNSLNYKPPQVRLYNVFFQACKVAKDSQGKKYDCNEQNSNKNNSI